MARYILNRRQQDSKSGNHYEVHNEETCNHLPLPENRINLGNFSGCAAAKAQAKTQYPSNAREIDGCYYCSNLCHVG